MNIELYANNFVNISKVKNEKIKPCSQNNLPKTLTQPSFGAGHSSNLSPEESAALASQNINNKQTVPDITEKDINFSVTCCGHSQSKGNSRKVFDYRCSMDSTYGRNWSKNFKNPHIVHNGNLDEKRNGETTALVIPLHPKTPGLRNSDNMTMVLNGNISQPVLNKLLLHMAEVGILNPNPIYDIKYYVNSATPQHFMSNPKIKTVIANFFKQKSPEETNSVNETKEIKNEKSGFGIKVTDINISNIDSQQDKNNKKEVKDYIRSFLKNNKEFTVIHDTFTENNQEKDMTAILIPSKKSNWDCITVTIDKKIPEQVCKNLLNYLAKNNKANVDNENFRTNIVEYLNNL